MTGESVLCRGLAERRAIVTGAGTGIGRACAALLARHGTGPVSPAAGRPGGALYRFKTNRVVSDLAP